MYEIYYSQKMKETNFKNYSQSCTLCSNIYGSCIFCTCIFWEEQINTNRKNKKHKKYKKQTLHYREREREREREIQRERQREIGRDTQREKERER
jgi:hypothetical protein